MKATDFEYRHQTLVHQLIVGAGFLTYLIQRDDVVWLYIRDSARPQLLERLIFATATLFVALGVARCIRERAYPGPDRHLRHQRYLGELVYAIGLGSLAPVSGFAVLVTGEALRIFRLSRLENGHAQDFHAGSGPAWTRAFRQEAAKCGVLITMIVFVVTLKDRVAEILIGASFLIGLLANAPIFSSSRRSGASG